MKKIFTLLLCVSGMAFASNAQDLTPVYQCIDALLSRTANTQMLMSPNFDANQDGVVNIHDVTFMINQALEAEQANAPARNIDIKALIHEVIESDTDTPNIDDVTNAINKKLNDEQE